MGGDNSGSVVIVGSGHGGFQVAASLRQAKFAGRVVLIGEETGLPYHRPPLSKEFLTGAMAEDAIRLRPAAFYDKVSIERISGVRVTAIDRAARLVTTNAGTNFPYDRLVLATGARNRVLPVQGRDLAGVMSLRTRDEAVALKARLAMAKNIVIVGGGFIGLEFAAVATQAGVKAVTILEVAPRLLARAVSPAISHALAAAHRRWGAKLFTGVSAKSLRGENGEVTGVETNTGEHIAADLVLVGIGAQPNTELAADAGLATENGILVDSSLRTADPAISAIGDCAAYPSPFAGAVIRLESVQNATDQARAVAAGILGTQAPYAAVPWFWSDQGTMKLQIVGLTTDHDQAIVRGDPASDSFSVFCFRAEKLLGIESINRPADHMAGRKILAAGGTITAAHAADENLPL